MVINVPVTRRMQSIEFTAPKRKRNAELTRRAILDSALLEFSELGYGDARVDSIAARSNTSKPMIYSYFGDKEGLYAAALREAYVQIRSGESELELESFSRLMPLGGWFISPLNISGPSLVYLHAEHGEPSQGNYHRQHQ